MFSQKLSLKIFSWAVIFLLFFSFFVLEVSIVNGVSGTEPNKGVSLIIENPLGKVGDIPALIRVIIDFLKWLALAIAPFFVILAGFHYLTSAGRPEKIKLANIMLIWALIGFAIVLVAEALVYAIQEFFAS